MVDRVLGREGPGVVRPSNLTKKPSKEWMEPISKKDIYIYYKAKQSKHRILEAQLGFRV